MKGYPGMSPLGRKPNTAPKLSYDYRRCITLVQVLAMDKSDGLKFTDCQCLANAWGVNPHGDYSELVQRLAQHAVEYTRAH